jgi:hypothetical protein
LKAAQSTVESENMPNKPVIYSVLPYLSVEELRELYRQEENRKRAIIAMVKAGKRHIGIAADVEENLAKIHEELLTRD